MKSAELLAEANLLLDWKPHYSLKMQASRFFSILSEARKLKHKQDYWFFYNMTSVSQCSNANLEFIQKLQTHYYDAFRVPNPLPNKVVAQKIMMLMGAMNNGQR